MVQLELVRPSRGHVTQFYGNTQPDGMPHAGQDYAYTNGVETFPEVYAAADGVVQFAGDSRNLGWPNPWYVNPDFNRADNWDSSAGNLIAIRHNQFSADTGYGHLEKCYVKAGDTVKAGQLIAIKGDTGNSYGKHLHFFLMFHPFNYNTSTYGCSDPNPYFTTITPQGGTTTHQEDDMPWNDAFDKDVRGSLQNITNEVRGLSDLNVDVRGDLANKGRQLAALTAATNQLAALLAEKQGLTVEDIRAALAGAIADGIRVTVGGSDG